MRSGCKFKLNDYRGAIDDCNKSLEIDSLNSNAFFYRGLTLSYQGKITEAIRDYDKTIKLSPDFARAYYNRGLLYIQLNQKEKGCLDFSKAGELGEEDAYTAIKNNCN